MVCQVNAERVGSSFMHLPNLVIGGKTGAEVEGHHWEYLLNAMGTQTIIAALVWATMSC